MENTNSPASSLVLTGVNSCLLPEVVRSDLLLSVNKMEKVGMLEEFESKCDFKNKQKKHKFCLQKEDIYLLGVSSPPTPHLLPPFSLPLYSFLSSPLPSFFLLLQTTRCSRISSLLK